MRHDPIPTPGLSATETACAPSAAVDLILPWAEVQAGDLVLLDDDLVIAERVDLVRKPWGDGADFTAADVFHVLGNGCTVVSERHGDRWTAVRRRQEG